MIAKNLKECLQVAVNHYRINNARKVDIDDISPFQTVSEDEKVTLELNRAERVSMTKTAREWVKLYPTPGVLHVFGDPS